MTDSDSLKTKDDYVPNNTPPIFSNQSNWLLEHRKIITSQLGEDGILEKIFEIIPNLNKWCVEFGAGNGSTLSNTYNLITNQGWSSVQIEGRRENYQLLAKQYADNSNVTCLNKFVNFEGEDTLDQILQVTSIPTDFDLLSIDVDGCDYHIWESTGYYRPKVLIIEFNPTIPNHVEFIQPRDSNVHQGNSLLSLIGLGKKKEYELICTTDWNAFFVDRKYYELFNIHDNSIWQMYRTTQYLTHVFQLFDGTIVIGGCNFLLWHNIELDLAVVQQEIQILPEEFRVCPG